MARKQSLHAVVAAWVLGASFLLTASARGQLFVGSAGENRIKRFDATTGDFQANSAILPATPFGIAFGLDHLLYVAVDGGANQVRRVDPITGADLGMFSQGGNMASPDGVGFGPGGDLFVVESVHGDVRQFDGISGAFEGIFTNGDVGIFSTRGLVFGSNGDLFVAHGKGNRVLRYNGTSGAFMGTFASGGGLNYPHGITFGTAGDLFVASYYSDQVLRYDGTTGAFEGVFAQGGGLDGPTGLSFGPSGDLFVSSFDSDQVLRFDGISGAAKGVFAQGSGLDGPLYLIFVPEPTGTLMVATAVMYVLARRTGMRSGCRLNA